MLMMNSGRLLSGHRRWGRGELWPRSVNEDLPGFVVMLDKTGGPISGAKKLVERLHAGRLPGRRPPRRRHADSQTSKCRWA